MGGLCSSQTPGGANRTDVEKDLAITKRLGDAARRQDAVHKMLLLGAGESGKSTLFKQMDLIYGKDPFPAEERKGYAQVIYANVIESIRTLIDMTDIHARDKPFTAKDREVCEKLYELDPSCDSVDDRVAGWIKRMWDHPAVQQAYAHRAKFHLTDSAAFYMHRIETIASDNFIPSEEFVLRSRSRTTGVVEKSFDIKGNTFTMYDVGGQRSERKKWIHCFEGVTCVLFVAAISSYDMCLYEDSKQNRMVEALELFDEVCNSRWFGDTTIVVFLNKRDLFEDKIKKVPITVCPAFTAYNGDMTFDPAVDYIMDQFERIDKRDTNKELVMHVTTATDKRNVSIVFETVKETVIKHSLMAAGLVM